MKKKPKLVDSILFAAVCLFLLIYMGIFVYLNMCRYTQHVDSDIAAEALLGREIWLEKDLTPDSWISSTERRVVGVSAISALFYGISGSMVFSMGISCVIVGGSLLLVIAFVLRYCRISRLGIAAALLALCALPINGLRNEDQMVPFVMLLWFLFAGYYAMHCVCFFLCTAFYIHLRKDVPRKTSKARLLDAGIWCFLAVFCAGLALGGMRCLQVLVLPLAVLECLQLFFESGRLSKALPRRRWVSAAFVLTLLCAAGLAKLYPTSVSYPMFFQDAQGIIDRLTRYIPAAVLEVLGISGSCRLSSFSALMQLGMIAVLVLTLYGVYYLFSKKTACPVDDRQRLFIQVLAASFIFTIFIEAVTTAELAPNYFFMIWFFIIAVAALLITHLEKASPNFARLIALCICIFALGNIAYTYKDCITTEDNLQEYQEVISYMDSQGISNGYAEFWDASRIAVMTDGRITMGHSYQMEDLRMYWWLTSTKWYVPNLPEDMPTAYVVKISDKTGFEAQFEDPGVVTLGFENERFAVYTSQKNLVRMQ